MSSPIQVVVLGGSYTGAQVAHNVLKNIPTAKVTLVNPSDLFYFNIAAPRILAKPAEAPLEKVLLSIPDAFKQYPAEKFEFVLGSVKSVDVPAKTVKIDTLSAPLKYDYLVIATGATTVSTLQDESIPFKPTPGNDLKEKIIDAQKRISVAQEIVIAGAGPVGVETAGEIAQAYPSKKVTLISSAAQLLPDLKASAGSAASKNLEKHGVKIILSAKVTDANQAGGKWTIKLNNDTTLTADAYIPATGSIPNTSFLDAQYLAADKGVKVDANLHVAGIEDGSVFALGDAASFPARYLLKAVNQIPVVAGNLKAAINKAGKVATYAQEDKTICFVPTGSDSGTGQVGGFVLFSFMVAMVKSKGFFISNAPSYLAAK